MSHHCWREAGPCLHAPLEDGNRRAGGEGPLWVSQGEYVLAVVLVLVHVGMRLEAVPLVGSLPHSYTHKCVLL